MRRRSDNSASLHRAIVLHPSALDVITAESDRALPLETGGILLGYREGHNIVVQEALMVSSTTATTHEYTRDDVLANHLLHGYLAARAPNDPVGYVGEWHSHPRPSRPSAVDIKAIRDIAKVSRGDIALLVYSPDGGPSPYGVVARRKRFGIITTQEVKVNTQLQENGHPGPLPPGAVNGDGPVFISYRQSDGTSRASSLEGLLQAAGLVVWRDRRDLPSGTITDRLEQALTGGLSAGVLVVTCDIQHSDVVKDTELPRLLQLAEDPSFNLCVANEVKDPANPRKPDYGAPDVLLGLTPVEKISGMKQSHSRTLEGRLQIVRDLLMNRIVQRRALILESGRTFSIVTQTRTETFALDAGQEDLQVRIMPPKKGRLPSGRGLKDLAATLPLTSDAIRASGASAVQIRGGMHLSVAFAIGAALPETKIGNVSVIDLNDQVWTSAQEVDPKLHVITTEAISEHLRDEEGIAKIAVFVALTKNPDETAFRTLLKEQSSVFDSATRISVDPVDNLESREAARISLEIAQEIKRLSAVSGRAEIHLAYQGPYTIAVLVGRHLNTLRTVIYEWDSPEKTGPRYTPVLTLEPGVTAGPITKVHI